MTDKITPGVSKGILAMYAYTYKCILIYINVHRNICMHINIYVSTSISIYIYTSVHVCISMCMCAHTYYSTPIFVRVRNIFSIEHKFSHTSTFLDHALSQAPKPLPHGLWRWTFLC